MSLMLGPQWIGACGRTPGCDGLPMEFYVLFWPVLGADLVPVLNSAFASCLMSRSQRHGVITLFFKKGDRLDPCNCRSITLLKFNYKIASCSISVSQSSSLSCW